MKIPFLLKRFLFSLDRTTLLACVFIPIIQYKLAQIAISLSFTNGASAIWPTTGFYLTAVLILGWRIWPALLLAEFIANTLFYEKPHRHYCYILYRSHRSAIDRIFDSALDRTLPNFKPLSRFI